MLPRTMRAARLPEHGEPLRIDEVDVPRPGPGEVLVRVEGAGCCHTDLHVMSGSIKRLPRLPLILGHENAGSVAAVGASVRSVREGDRVAVFGGWGCGHCDLCVAGEENLCANGQRGGLSERDGGFAEYLLVPHERYLVPLRHIPPREAAPLTDAGLTPYRAIRRTLEALTPGRAVLVIGCGGLGQYAVRLLRILTACEVIVADVAADKREIARAAGAHHVLDSREPSVRDAVLELSRGGVAAAYDFVGADATLALAASVTRRLGHVVQIGLAGGTAHLKALDTIQQEVSFHVSFWGNIRELREVIALADDGRLTSIPLEIAPLDDINAVFERMRRGAIAGRAVVVP